VWLYIVSLIELCDPFESNPFLDWERKCESEQVKSDQVDPN
jgi:hypothetical protein